MQLKGSSHGTCLAWFPVQLHAGERPTPQAAGGGGDPQGGTFTGAKRFPTAQGR